MAKSWLQYKKWAQWHYRGPTVFKKGRYRFIKKDPDHGSVYCYSLMKNPSPHTVKQHWRNCESCCHCQSHTPVPYDVLSAEMSQSKLTVRVRVVKNTALQMINLKYVPLLKLKTEETTRQWSPTLSYCFGCVCERCCSLCWHLTCSRTDKGES